MKVGCWPDSWSCHKDSVNVSKHCDPVGSLYLPLQGVFTWGKTWRRGFCQPFLSEEERRQGSLNERCSVSCCPRGVQGTCEVLLMATTSMRVEAGQVGFQQPEGFHVLQTPPVTQLHVGNKTSSEPGSGSALLVNTGNIVHGLPDSLLFRTATAGKKSGLPVCHWDEEH